MSITIAIPFYNAEKYLMDAIRSVFAQTYQDWELILLDDGSTDSSLAIAKKVKDPRVRVFSDGVNKKLAARLNEITHLAKFNFIARMDADDLMFPNRLEEQMKYFKIDPDLDLVTTGVYSVSNNLNIIGLRGMDFDYPKFQDILSRKIGITHAALLVKKSWYQRNKYDENLNTAQDLDLWIKSSKKNDLKVKSISNYLYIYREENNVSRRKLLRAYKNERRMIIKYANTSVNLVFKSYLKSLVVIILNFIGKINLLQPLRRKGNITEIHKNDFNKVIKIIRNTKIPGIDYE